MKSQHVSRVVAATPQAVYAFAADVDNLPRWAAGLAQADVQRDRPLCGRALLRPVAAV